MKRMAWLVALGLVFSVVRAQAPLPTSPPNTLLPALDYVHADRLGIAFISSADQPVSEDRYQRALLLGAGWNRWPLYWDRVELAAGRYQWAAYDQVVAADLAHGLKIDAILLGRPDFHKGDNSIVGLHRPVFSDGSDVPEPGKTINADNPWAGFVYAAVTRYMPGGLLAQHERLSEGQGIRVWEVWNEPDLLQFWPGSIEDYARLLKVTYLVAHYADPAARVMFGGLAYNNPGLDDWLGQVLAIYARDPHRDAHNWYMDMVAVHNYTDAARSGIVVRSVRETLERFDLVRSVWLTESGVPVWDDYPGPVWAVSDPTQRRFWATAQQAAAFVIQSTVYAWAEGADVVFFHQLFDDCGNQPSGTTFPPHNGELCRETALCWGDAHGLYRNTRSAACFSQHPLAGTPRPAATAFRLLAQVFGGGPFDGGGILDINERAVVLTFNRQTMGQQIYVLWNRSLERVVVDIPAAGQEATLYSMNNQDWLVTPNEGMYHIGLPPATPDDFPFLRVGEVAAIGGPTFILVERTQGDTPTNLALLPAQGPLGTPIPLTVTSGEASAVVRPTVDPGQDSNPPVTSMIALPVVSPPTFIVTWSGQDNSGIEHYLVWVRVNGGDWQPWLETSRTEAQYSGASGNTYEFAVWAVDLAGNWSLNTDLQPQAITHVQ